MIKYDKESLYKAFDKISREHIKRIRDKIKEYLNTLDPNIQKLFFIDYKNDNYLKDYNGYTICNNYIGIMVYCYTIDIYSSDSDSEKFNEAVKKILQIIANEKLPFKFKISATNNRSVPIEIRISISDLVKLVPDIGRKTELEFMDGYDFIEKSFLKKSRAAILSGLKSIGKQYKNNNFEFAQLLYLYSNYSDMYFLKLASYYDEVDVTIKKNIISDLNKLMAKYIPFKYSIVDDEYKGIICKINYSDIKNHELALKFLNENTSIFNLTSIIESIGII